MLTRMLRATALAGSIFLGSCASAPIPPLPPPVLDVITQTQQAILKACNWSEPWANLALIFGKNIDGLQTVAQVRDAVCKAVKGLSVKRRMAPVTVGGVVLTGHKVR